MDGLFRNRVVELLESQDDVRGNKNVIVFPPSGIFVYPRTILALITYEQTAEVLAPVNFGSIGAFELVDTCGDQTLGHGMVVVIQALLSKAGVLFQGVVISQPPED